MIFGASLYPCIIHHHNPKSPSKNWGTFVLQPSLFLSKSSNKMFATTTKNCTDFPAKVKQEKKQKYHRHQPKNKMRSSSFFSKKKKKYHWEYKTKEAIRWNMFSCFHLDFSGFVLLWEELLSFVVLRTLHALPPKSGSPTWGNHEQQGEGGEHKSQFF